ncbi:MAG TPA: hypothetical protein ENJ22_01120 [Gammaproteobacteria bacterium]|nr:hypothetical protein [Gammaproteobacteria bacterium]
MIVLFTDFGLEGPYLGQVRAVLMQEAPQVPVIDLFANAPACNPRAASYLLHAYTRNFPPGTVFLCVVDPGVGSRERRPVVVRADERFFVGPDNGLFNRVAQAARAVQWQEILWRPDSLSATFHGRDLFAPIAARLAAETVPPAMLSDPFTPCLDDWPQDLYEVIYIDHFGNAMTGIGAGRLGDESLLVVKDRQIAYAHHYAEVPRGEAFWYRNANGLVEIAVNCGSAASVIGLRLGDPVSY